MPSAFFVDPDVIEKLTLMSELPSEWAFSAIKTWWRANPRVVWFNLDDLGYPSSASSSALDS
jgi:hypothetical protein